MKPVRVYTLEFKVIDNDNGLFVASSNIDSNEDFDDLYQMLYDILPNVRKFINTELKSYVNNEESSSEPIDNKDD